MRILVKAVIYLAVLGLVALMAFAIFSDLPAPSREVSIPIEAR